MAGILALPFLGGAGAAGSTAAGAGAAAGGATMAEILSQAAQAPAVGAAPTIAAGISQPGPGLMNSEFLNYLDKGIRLGQLAGVGQQPTAVTPAGGGDEIQFPTPPTPQMPTIQPPQPYQPTAVSFLEMLKRGM